MPYPAITRRLTVVTTPAGDPVAMVHCNNCTTDLNAWVDVFDQFARAAGLSLNKETDL